MESKFKKNVINYTLGKDLFTIAEIKNIISRIEKLGEDSSELSNKERLAILFLRTGPGRFLTDNYPYNRRYKLLQKTIKTIPFPDFSENEEESILNLFEWSSSIFKSKEKLDYYVDNNFLAHILFQPLDFIFIERLMDITPTELSFLDELEKIKIPLLSDNMTDILPIIKSLREKDSPIRNNMLLFSIRIEKLNSEVCDILDSYKDINELKATGRYSEETEKLDLKRAEKIPSLLSANNKEVPVLVKPK